METPKPMLGTWTLTAPDGRTWQADTLARVVAMANEPDFSERHVQLGKFYGATNTDALIDAMFAQIVRLQEKMQMMRLP